MSFKSPVIQYFIDYGVVCSMISIKEIRMRKYRTAAFLLIILFVISGCSGSSDSVENDGQNNGEDPTNNGAGPLPEPNPSIPASTLVNFDITVPAYMSDELQVRLAWGDINITAEWVQDENWAISETFPAGTENLLTVTFAGRNGSITLGSFESTFRTGTGNSEIFQIAADQFDTGRWDSDDDGISNLDELIAGTNPSVADNDTSPVTPPASTPSTSEPQAFEATIELVPEKVFRLSWGESSAATHYRVLENPDGNSGFNPVSGDLSVETRSFDHRVPLFRRLNARYMVQACNDLSCISSEELFLTGSLSRGVGTIAPRDNDELDASNFIALSRDGGTLVVGSIGDDSAAVGINGDQLDNSSENTGAVRVYRLNNGAWQQQAFIKASNPDPDDLFGRELSLSADGNTLAVGVEQESSAAAGINGDQLDNSLVDAGAVYLFSFNDGSWQQQGYLKPSNPGLRYRFGSSVSLSASGNTLAVGARNEPSDSDSISFQGAVYLFERTSDGWQQQAHISPGSPVIGGGRLNTSNISLSEDGDTLAVGGSLQIDLAQGGAFVLERNDGVWRQQSYIDPAVIGAHPSLGLNAGALSDDGRTLVLSAIRDFSPATGINADPFASTDIIRDSGAVHVFTFVDGSWRQQAYIKSTVPEVNASFGRSVALSADGDTIAVLSRDDTGGLCVFDGYNFISEGSNLAITGFLTSAYIYYRNLGVWSEGAYIKPPESEFIFLEAMALDATGDTFAIGSLIPNFGDDPDRVPVDSVVYTY